MQAFHETLASNHQFKVYGYKTYRNSRDDFNRVKHSFKKYLETKLCEFSGKDCPDFSLEDFHRHLEELGVDQHEFIKVIGRKVPHDVLDLKFIDKLIEIANEDLQCKFRIYKSNIEFRVVRPNLPDNNERHRDHWFPYFLPLVNVYVPLAGSLYDSAMRIVPFSHDWSEDDVIPTFTYEEAAAGKKYIKNGVAYSVPAVKTCKKEINVHSPDLTDGDFMLFSPKLVHGGGGNGSQITRFSFEIRLEPISD